jgi:hypothetical protein
MLTTCRVQFATVFINLLAQIYTCVNTVFVKYSLTTYPDDAMNMGRRKGKGRRKEEQLFKKREYKEFINNMRLKQQVVGIVQKGKKR